MWGVRNGPPYPLDKATHNKVKKQKDSKVGSFLSLDPGDIFDKDIGYDTKKLQKLSEIFNDSSERTRFSLDARDVGTKYIAAHPMKKDSQWESNDFDKSKYKLDIDTISRRNPMVMPEYFDDNENAFLQNQMKKVNPFFNKSDWLGVKNNCAKCSASLALMKMGYNQVQAGYSTGGAKFGAMQNWFIGGVHKKTNELSDISKALDDAKPGSFGTLGCGRAVIRGDGVAVRESGHEVSWTKTRNGKIRIEDGQSGKIYNSFEDLVKDQKFSSGVVADFNDLTNARPNWSALAADSVCSLPNNTKVINSYSDNLPTDRWRDGPFENPEPLHISRQYYRRY